MANKTWIGTDGSYLSSSNWSTSGAPANGDHVRIPAGSGAINGSSLDASGSSIGDFIVEEGYTNVIGSSSGYLKIYPTGRVVLGGTGKAYVDISDSGTTAVVNDAATPDTGDRGLYLLGGDIGSLFVNKGAVGLAWRFGEAAGVQTVRVGYIASRNTDASVWVGPAATVTTWQQTGGTNRLAYASTSTTVTVDGGSLTLESTAQMSAVTVNGGTLYHNGPGGITTLTVNAGTADLTKSLETRTIGTVKLGPRATLKYNPLHVTISAWSTPDYPVSINVSDP